MEEGKRRGGALAALLAVGALGVAAVPAYGALNGSDSSDAPATQQSVPDFVQERPDRGENRDKDCPWKDGQRGGEGDRGQGQGGSGTLY